MEKINFEVGTQVSPAKVTIDNIDHEVTPAVWEGNTPLSPFVLNKMQDNIEDSINELENKRIEITTGVEYGTNEYIDGKQVFRKRIDIGNLPNATSIDIATELNNVNIIKIEGECHDSQYNTTMPLPYIASYISGCIGIISISKGSSIRITAGDNRSTWLGIIELYYTKN